MKILESESNRRKEVHEYLTTTHMFCLIAMVFALVLGKNFFDLNNPKNAYLNLIGFLVISLVGIVLITIYNNKDTYLGNDDIKLTWIDFIYVGFPLVMAGLSLFLVGNTHNIKAVLLLPVIISSSVLGKKAGLVVSAICTFFIFIQNSLAAIPVDFIIAMEDNVILICVMFIVAWFIGAQTDFDKQYRLQLTKLASTDLLTGLYNYGYFQEKILEYIEKASSKHPLSLIILDIDYFKHYNDIHGHQAGDLLLNGIGEVLNKKVNDHGFVARYGGDEFVIVLPDTGSKKSKQLAEDINIAVMEQGFPGEEFQPEGHITVSCGIAVYPTHARNIKDLIRHADLALYRAKNKDKNKVEMYFSVFDNLEVEEDEKELLNSIRTLVSVINAKDRYTYGHSERVTDNAIKLATRLGLPQEEIQILGYAAFLHDIGKIEVDREVLNKATPLTKKEWEIMKRHPEWGSVIVKAMRKLHPTVPVILHHHENFDGSGYPAGLKGEEIPILARIIRIADCFDAMTSERPYKEPLDVLSAIEEMKANSGTQFDPELVPVFLEIIQEEMEAEQQMGDS